MGSTLIHGATVLSVDAENRVFEGGFIAIRDGRISGVGPGPEIPDPAGFDEVQLLEVVQELRIECFFPADDRSDALFRSLAAKR